MVYLTFVNTQALVKRWGGGRGSVVETCNKYLQPLLTLPLNPLMLSTIICH